MKPLKTLISFGLFCFMWSNLLAQAPAPASAQQVDVATRLQVVDSLSACLISTYVYKDTALKMADYIHARLKNGAYNSITDPAEFAQALNADVHGVYNDKHLGIQFNPGLESMLKDTTHKGNAEQSQRGQLQAARQNYGFNKVEVLNGNIGYIRLDGFFSVDTNSKATVKAVFTFLRNVDALIFDLRQNGGGDPTMVQHICSYLLKNRTHLNDLYERRTNKTDQSWTDPAISSPTLSVVPVYVLVSGRTFSGGEEFSYDLQSLKRGTIVGETTGGGAHPVRPITISNGFIGNIPFARAINPVTKKNWEAVGVKPDISIAADSAVDEAQLSYFNDQIKYSKDEDRIKSLTWARDMLNARMRPYKPDTTVMSTYVGTYGGRAITLKNGDLYYSRMGMMAIKLIALSANTFKATGMDNLKLQFNKNNQGKVDEMLFLFDNGSTANYKRQ